MSDASIMQELTVSGKIIYLALHLTLLAVRQLRYRLMVE